MVLTTMSCHHPSVPDQVGKDSQGSCKLWLISNQCKYQARDSFSRCANFDLNLNRNENSSPFRRQNETRIQNL